MAGIHHSTLSSQQATQSLTASQIESVQLLYLSTQELIPLVESTVASNPLLIRQEKSDSETESSPETTPFDTPVGICPNYERENPFFTWRHTDTEQSPCNTLDNIESPFYLSDFLYHQLAEIHCSQQDKQLIAWLIGNLDDKGFLAEPLETLVKGAPYQVPFQLWTDALKTLQQFEPTGIATCSPKEFLLQQISHCSKSDTIKECARKILIHVFEDNDFPAFDAHSRDGYGQHPTQITTAALQLIHSLCPYPTFGLKTSSEVSTVVPEVVLRQANQSLTVELNDFAIDSLEFDYATFNLLKQSKLDTGQKNAWQTLAASAKSFLHALEYRYSTIIAISQYIVTQQKSFFLGYTQSLIPLTQKDIANALGIHESTVSRAVSGKYIQTSRGTFELKSLFCAPAGSSNISIDAVIERIRTYISKENSTHPLSDTELTATLASEGIPLSRRTVAKYREMAGIVSKQQRKAKN